MNTKIKLLITLAIGMYFFTSCDNGTTTTTDKDNTDSTKMSNLKNDTMKNKMDDMKKNDNGLTTSMNKMMDKMSSMKMTGDFDMDFANMMIEHHQGAIDMSKIEVAKGIDEKIKGMARNIITNQSEEIGKMQEIIKNYKPSGMEMGKHDELTKEMEDMKAKMNGIQMTGNTDKDFVMMMVPHHEGAIKMFKDEISHGMNAALKQMAKKGISDQAKEITEFKSWINSKK
jgi:uncharacterized protein (DUF305 family)